MKTTLVVVADLGGFKAFRLQDQDLKLTPRLELLEEYKNPKAHERLVDQVTDQAGRFSLGGTPGGATSAGERHNYDLELRKRFIRELAQRVNAIALSPEFERCFMAASKVINHQLMEELDPQVRAKIAKVVPADLTKVERAEILGHF